MPRIAAISRERHAGKGWRRFTSYAFAHQTALVPLVAAELPKAAMALPLTFIRQGDGYVPAALMGLEPGRNLFVAPDGRWLGRYVPSALRGYPFSLARTEDETLVLCIDEDSGLLADAAEGEPLFTATGEPADSLGKIMEFLRQIEGNRAATTQACAALERYALIQPWPVTLKGEAGERRVEGLFQIDESALNQLPDAAFLELRQAAALPLAYCQMLSMQHLSLLGELAEAHAKAPDAAKAGGAFALPEDDQLHFDWNQTDPSP